MTRLDELSTFLERNIPFVTREDHWIAMLASGAMLARCLRKTYSYFYVVHSQSLPQWISLNFWKGSGEAKEKRLNWSILSKFSSILFAFIDQHHSLSGYAISFSHQPCSCTFLQTKLAQSKHGKHLYPAGQCAVLQGPAGSKHEPGKPRLQRWPKNKQEKQTNK